MFDNVFWAAISGQINRWRKQTLGLRSTSIDKMDASKTPFLYNFSSAIVPPRAFALSVFGLILLDHTRSPRLARMDSRHVCCASMVLRYFLA